jgi:hypothetical protein
MAGPRIRFDLNTTYKDFMADALEKKHDPRPPLLAVLPTIRQT